MDVVLGLLAALFWGGTDFLVGLIALLRLVGPALAGKALIATPQIDRCIHRPLPG